MYVKCCELWCSCVYRRRLCTQMLQIKDVFFLHWSNDVLQLRSCWSPGDATSLVETSCYNCTRKQHTLKAVEKVSRNIELYSCQTTHLKPKRQKLLPILQKHQRLNWTADHVNATYGLNMKTRLRYVDTSHLYYTTHPRSPCGRTAFISLFARSQQ